MTRYQDLKELESVAQVTPVPTWTRRTKLLRLAELARQFGQGAYFRLWDMVESWSAYDLQHHRVMDSGTILGVAVRDPQLTGAGLPPNASVKDCMEFFDITQEELHLFSCNCGGNITSNEMARRIEGIAR